MDWIFNKVSPVNFVTYAQVRGDISEEKLFYALDCLKNRHPLLSAGIAGHGWWSARLICNHSSDIPLKILSSENGHELIPVIEAECMERIPDKGPLGRCVLFRHSRSLSTLMLTLDHAIADGMSGVFALRDLMLALGYRDDKTGSSLKPLEPAKPVEHYFPKDMLGLRGWLKHIVFFIKTIKNDFSAKNIVPCIPADESRKMNIGHAILKSGMEELITNTASQYTIFITDDRHYGYRTLCNDWCTSNPEGYSIWFDYRMNRDRLLKLIEKAQIDDIPMYLRKTPLQRAIQM